MMTGGGAPKVTAKRSFHAVICASTRSFGPMLPRAARRSADASTSRSDDWRTSRLLRSASSIACERPTVSAWARPVLANDSATRTDATRADATRTDATRTDPTRTDPARTGETRTGETTRMADAHSVA